MNNTNWDIFSFDVLSQVVEKTRITIYFTCDDVRYSLDVFQNTDELFEPYYVFHLQTYCHFCSEEDNGKGIDFCAFFQTNRYSLFQHLIQHPKIRLKWLHIAHI